MNYQVCWVYEDEPDAIWTARFFKNKEEAMELFREKKQSNIVTSVKILTIGGKHARN